MPELAAQEQRDQLEQDGFVVLPRPLVPPAQVAEVTALLDPLFARFPVMPDTVAHDLGGVRAPGTTHIAELEYVTSLAPALRGAPLVAAAREVASGLLGAPARLVFDHAIYKPAGSPSITPWHQDSAYDPSGRELVTIWVALQDTTVTNGCMRYLPGSHRNGRIPHLDLPERHGRTVAPFDESPARDATVEIGGAVVHREHTLHSSGPNHSNKTRRALILQFTRTIRLADSVRIAAARAHARRISRKQGVRTPVHLPIE